MTSNANTRHVSEAQAREVAEQARETQWRSDSFLKELFLGNLRLDLIDPYPAASLDRPEFVAWFADLERFVREEVDPIAIEEARDYPPHVIDGLKRLGAFGMKIPKEYGGLGLSQSEYDRVMHLVGSVDANLVALLSAHQSIGVPQPLKLFGTEEQKKKYLPRCAKGAISAFALTEPDVGSDPARLATTVRRDPETGDFILDGEKLWCTNGTIAELFVVMARHAESGKISAFVVERAWEGVEVTHHCRFMGLHALSNAALKFRGVRVPKENLIGKEGRGLKIALVTLNAGRLAIPAAIVGGSKTMLALVRRFAVERVQWGVPVGRHEAVAHRITDMAAFTFAMEAVSRTASGLADRDNYDIRLEAAAAKEFNSYWGWQVVDHAMQIRGGRGYETAASLRARGEAPWSVEKPFRDARINRIFEGSSEIMHLFMAREAVDTHLQVAGAMVDPKKGLGDKLRALPAIAKFYLRWYPSRWWGWGHWPRFHQYGRLAPHVRFIDRMSRKLARAIFHGMVVHGPKLERKQGFLFRVVDIGMELFAMACSVSRARRMRWLDDPHADEASALCDVFCRGARRRVRAHFRALWRNDDTRRTRLARKVLDGAYAWMEDATIPLPEAPSTAAEQGDKSGTSTETEAAHAVGATG